MNDAVLYARYSNDKLQTDKSVSDQFALGRIYAERNGWNIVDEISDPGVSVSMLKPPGIVRLLADARAKKFDILICEATDRLSRDQENLAHIYKHLTFCGVKIYCVNTGLVTSATVAMSGFVDSQFIEILSKKTHRGQSGRVRDGNPIGGRHYGYKSEKSVSPKGRVITSPLAVYEPEARVVRRIYLEYAEGRSPLKIVADLNRDGIPSPNGGVWRHSSLLGCRQRTSGILNLTIFHGEVTWNKSRRPKDPTNGKRPLQYNPEEEWITVTNESLRIVPEELWQRVRARQAEIHSKGTIRRMVRPVYLLSGLAKCGQCGRTYARSGRDHMRCSGATDMQICTNRKAIRYERLETLALKALQKDLMNEGLVQEFCEDYVARANNTLASYNAQKTEFERDLEQTNRALERMVASIASGVNPTYIRDELNTLGAKKERLTSLLANCDEVPPYIHPRMADVYAKGINKLIETFQDPDKRGGAVDSLRKLIGKIILTPTENGELSIDFQGNLAGILQICQAESQRMNLRTPAQELVLATEIEQIEPLVAPLPPFASRFVPPQMRGGSKCQATAAQPWWGDLPSEVSLRRFRKKVAPPPHLTRCAFGGARSCGPPPHAKRRGEVSEN